jgi:hypothetical protein
MEGRPEGRAESPKRDPVMPSKMLSKPLILIQA